MICRFAADEQCHEETQGKAFKKGALLAAAALKGRRQRSGISRPHGIRATRQGENNSSVLDSTLRGTLHPTRSGCISSPGFSKTATIHLYLMQILIIL